MNGPLFALKRRARAVVVGMLLHVHARARGGRRVHPLCTEILTDGTVSIENARCITNHSAASTASLRIAAYTYIAGRDLDRAADCRLNSFRRCRTESTPFYL